MKKKIQFSLVYRDMWQSSVSSSHVKISWLRLPQLLSKWAALAVLRRMVVRFRTGKSPRRRKS